MLDMQDVHSLRLGKQRLVEEMDRSLLLDGENCGGDNDSKDASSSTANNTRSIRMTKQVMDRVMAFDPSCNNNDYDESNKRKKAHDTFLRELASVHRSDLTCMLINGNEASAIMEYPKMEIGPCLILLHG